MYNSSREVACVFIVQYSWFLRSSTRRSRVFSVLPEGYTGFLHIEILKKAFVSYICTVRYERLDYKLVVRRGYLSK
jgi:hypothetical protein